MRRKYEESKVRMTECERERGVLSVAQLGACNVHWLLLDGAGGKVAHQGALPDTTTVLGTIDGSFFLFSFSPF